jgi:hypothetical protein
MLVKLTFFTAWFWTNVLLGVCSGCSPTLLFRRWLVVELLILWRASLVVL